MRFERGLLAALVLLLVFSGQITYILTELRWFATLGYSSVYETMIAARALLFLVSALAFLAVSLANLKFVGERPRYLSWVVVLLSIFFGLVAQGGWERVLLALNAQPFGVPDPLFGMDVGFFVFTLPFVWALWYAIFVAAVINLAIAAGAYLYLHADRMIFDPVDRDYAEIARSIPERAIGHIGAILGILALLFSIRYLLDRYELLYTGGGVVYGAGYADVHARLPFLYVFAAVAAISALLLFAVAAGKRSPRIPLAIAVLVVGAGAAGTIYPVVVQQYSVAPNELTMERPFIAHNIYYTRLAYALDEVEVKDFPVDYNLTGADIRINSDTVDNIRIWDWRPLLTTYKQLQEIRLYYEFLDADVDRYVIDEKRRQVMVSAREISTEKLPDQAKTWQNVHLFYTHGYGVAMSPVNTATEEGLPDYFVKNIPPESVVGEIDRPEIYYGEGRKDYVITNTNVLEFDYPLGDQNVYTTYAGTGGVLLDPVMKLLMAYRQMSLKILLSKELTGDSRIMIHRNILDRAQSVAPFLAYDGDPYIVLADGRLFWIIDAYTISDRYPYSEPSGRFNYIRNPVKVVIDAYNGTVNYYVIEDDPIIRAYEAIFPDLFCSIDSMSEELLAHIRYPVDLFSIQAGVYQNYHMTDPQIFYNKEDAWETPTEIYQERSQPMEPYYVIMKIPESETGEEFMLIQPFAPRTRNNMIGWMAAMCDQPKYGEILVYRFPKDQLVYGPMQIEARIDQSTEISEQLTLWDQMGSTVIRGNLLVIPIDNSLLYVEPIYLRADVGELPELRRVVVSYGNRLVMEESLEIALGEIFDLAPEVQGRATYVEGDDLSTGDLVARAGSLYRSAQDQLRAGNWSGYGEDIDRLGEVIRVLEERAGS
ncbi:MAG: UPF0182 family protein [Methanothrix sp.]|jgi:hypothetical protein|uniref:UPF0182 protein XD72_0814 n=1 Tax=Methanothrix harundinacea TaxID=301375 RepID=A0A101IKN6_9EURY|nr:MAG: hypothetical protein APR56_12075 [Methanosaeta sp. SDB]KUK44779.1 MAG: hypothetical protein XD72_0814 [Methanothrix harundinacea]MDD3709323.1 UPF0182 family protein [Methanothrix sp.]MDI9399433.1 UPF0182 family protein [Euryarchaeota archaeon]KUK96858.1 MAG: hypothetical protein XE07_0809 [Methanothrix harundinacea]